MLLPGLLPFELFFEKKKETNYIAKPKKNRDVTNHYSIIKKNKKKTLSLLYEIVNKLYYFENFQKRTYIDSLRFKEISIQKEFMFLKCSLGIELHLLNQNFEMKSLVDYLEKQRTDGVYKKGTYGNSFIIIYNIENLTISKQKEIQKLLEKIHNFLNVILVGSKKTSVVSGFKNIFLTFKKKKLKNEKKGKNKSLYSKNVSRPTQNLFLRNTTQHKLINLFSKKKTSQLSIWSFLGYNKTLVSRKGNLTGKTFLFLFDPFNFPIKLKKKSRQILLERCILKSLFRYYLKDLTKEKPHPDQGLIEKWKRVEFLKFSIIINIVMRHFNKNNPRIFYTKHFSK